MDPQIIEYALFSVFSLVTLAGGVGTVAFRDPVKAALSLIASFFGLACLYLLQAAELIAVLQILVYAGAIMVLFVFVIMLVQNKDAPIVNPGFFQRAAVPFKLIVVAMVSLVVLYAVRRTSLGGSVEQLPTGFGSVAAVGHEFFDNYLFHFELTSVLLLVGIVGAVILSKRPKA